MHYRADYSKRIAIIVYLNNSHTERYCIQVVDVEADSMDEAIELATEYAENRYGKELFEIESDVYGITKLTKEK